MSGIINLENYNIKKIRFYSPFNFLREYTDEELINETIINPIEVEYKNKNINVIDIKIENYNHLFIYKKLDWDTNYFNFNNYRIELILYNHKNINILRKAINQFLNKISIFKNAYFFINIPSEDIMLLQALSTTPFVFIETRLNYYLDNISAYTYERYPVKKATIHDIPHLKKVAKKSRNPFDRVHADPAFTDENADEYLGTFAEESVKGFADFVLIPDIPDKNPFGFLACNNPVQIFDKKIAKLVLAAVDNTIEKGWLFKLLSEGIYKLKETNCDILTTITQSANRPAIYVWEKAGFKLAFTTHLFSVSLHD